MSSNPKAFDSTPSSMHNSERKEFCFRNSLPMSFSTDLLH